MAGDDRIGRIEAAMLATLDELQRALERIALLESELLAFRSISGSLAAEIVRQQADPQQALATLGGELMAKAARVAEEYHAMRGEASPVFVKYTEVVESVIVSAEESLVRRP